MRPLAIIAFALGLSLANEAAAQHRHFGAIFGVGTGASASGGQDSTVVRRTPLFIDAGVKTWTVEHPNLVYGGLLRLEVEGHAAVAMVPFVGYRREFGPVAFRPVLALPFFFYPFTMLGPELGLTTTFEFLDGVAAYAGFLVDVFVWGDDVPEGQIVAMFNGVVGLEMEF